MTKLLEEAVKKLSQLPKGRQDELAQMLIERVMRMKDLLSSIAGNPNFGLGGPLPPGLPNLWRSRRAPR